MRGPQKGRRLTVSTPLKKRKQVNAMTAIAPLEATGPVPAPVSPSPSRGVGTRRKFRLAALVRRNRRRATWIRAERAGELPPLAFLTTCVGAITLSLALSAWVWVR